MAKVMKVIYQIRQDTSSNFTNKNPILYSGEFAYETDTGEIKIGDGKTNWKNLGYFEGKQGPAGTSVKVLTATTTYQVSANGTTIPSGDWSQSVPTTSAGEFLWSKTEIGFSDGNTAVSYGVSRNGMDGSTGSVGPAGKDGQRGTQWLSGTALTVTAGTEKLRIRGVLIGDYYLNINTGNVYVCEASDSTSATYSYQGCIKGVAGKDGAIPTIDEQLDANSVNPVQNKVVSHYIFLLQGLENTKVDKETGKGLSTNDYTDSAKQKLTDLPTKSVLEALYAKKSDLPNIATSDEAGLVKIGTGLSITSNGILSVTSSGTNFEPYFKEARLSLRPRGILNITVFISDECAERYENDPKSFTMHLYKKSNDKSGRYLYPIDKSGNETIGLFSDLFGRGYHGKIYNTTPLDTHIKIYENIGEMSIIPTLNYSNGEGYYFSFSYDLKNLARLMTFGVHNNDAYDTEWYENTLYSSSGYQRLSIIGRKRSARNRLQAETQRCALRYKFLISLESNKTNINLDKKYSVYSNTLTILYTPNLRDSRYGRVLTVGYQID